MNHCKKVTGILRLSQLPEVERRLQALGVKGVTITLVKGFGEWHPTSHFGYGKDLDEYADHIRIEIFIESGMADSICDAIAQAAHTGEAGDGIVAVLPVDRFVHIRTGGACAPEALPPGAESRSSERSKS